MINDYLTLSFKSKLLIQDEIKGDSITISHTGPLNYVANNKFEHYTYINGNYYKNTTQNIKVLNSNGLRYINLDIIIKTPRGEDWYGHFVRHLLPKINMISFLIKSDSSNKIYNLIPSNIKNVNVKKPNYTINNISEVF